MAPPHFFQTFHTGKKHMKKRVFLTFLLIFACVPAAASDAPMTIFVSIPPQKYFVNAIAGGRAAVSVMVRPGASPADYEPSPSQMAALAETKIYFTVGVPFEDPWLEKFTEVNPDLKVVHTEAGIKKRPISRYSDFLGGAPDSAAQGHRHGILDPHIWLSPPLVEIQARHIKDGLAAADPEHRSLYEANYENFIRSVKDLDARIRAEFKNLPNRYFLVFHPSWGYFADAYDLRQVAVEEEGKDPKARHVAQIVEMARKYKITTIFVQPQFSSKFAAVVAREIGGELVEADPLAEDWRENLLRVAGKMKKALR